MRIYIAASYHRREEALAYAQILKQDGHVITSQWLEGEHEYDGTGPEIWAQEDLDNLVNSTCVLSFTEPLAGAASHKRGGRHVEFGMGYVLGYRTIVIGPKEHCFHHLKDVEHCTTFDDARNLLKKTPARAR